MEVRRWKGLGQRNNSGAHTVLFSGSSGGERIAMTLKPQMSPTF